MHRKIIEHASNEQVREFLTDTISMLKSTSPDLYSHIEKSLYTKIYGEHFCDWLLEKALMCMTNEDGTTGGHWTLNETTKAANSYGIAFKDFNMYDWCYVMNMLYSDYYGVISDDPSFIKLSKKFLEDKDGPDGKAFKYYMDVVRG